MPSSACKRDRERWTSGVHQASWRAPDAAEAPAAKTGLLGVSLAFGLTVLTMAYAVGHISGGYLVLS